MKDLNDLFLKADTHLAARAARGRVEAINAAPDLVWLVEVQNGGATLTLDFDHSPNFGQIVQRVRNLGLWGEVDVRSITVGRKRPRPLLLTQWARRRREVQRGTHPSAA